MSLAPSFICVKNEGPMYIMFVGKLRLFGDNNTYECCRRVYEMSDFKSIALEYVVQGQKILKNA